jgi:hypothetical protein
VAILSACASIRGFPDDPADRPELSPYFGPGSERAYDEARTEKERLAAREEIVRHRLYGYDVTYSDFKRRLATDSNIVSAGGGLLALTLGGLAATAGNLTTSSALAAAGAGVVGAQGVVSRELYFQRTLPALLAQMDAARDQVILAILTGLSQPITLYPLVNANVDLQKLKDAGSIDGAINMINQQTANEKAKAQSAIFIQRKPEFVETEIPRETVTARLKSLNDAQVVKLANAMLGRLDQASPEAQQVARVYAPPGGVFTPAEARRARFFVTFWVQYETMTADRAAQWNAAIDDARKT